MSHPYLIDAASLEDGPALAFLYPPDAHFTAPMRPVKWCGRDMLISPEEQLVILARGDALLWTGCDMSSSPDHSAYARYDTAGAFWGL